MVELSECSCFAVTLLTARAPTIASHLLQNLTNLLMSNVSSSARTVTVVLEYMTWVLLYLLLLYNQNVTTGRTLSLHR